jgi:hypothetical protein
VLAGYGAPNARHARRSWVVRQRPYLGSVQPSRAPCPPARQIARAVNATVIGLEDAPAAYAAFDAGAPKKYVRPAAGKERRAGRGGGGGAAAAARETGSRVHTRLGRGHVASHDRVRAAAARFSPLISVPHVRPADSRALPRRTWPQVIDPWGDVRRAHPQLAAANKA